MLGKLGWGKARCLSQYPKKYALKQYFRYKAVLKTPDLTYF